MSDILKGLVDQVLGHNGIPGSRSNMKYVCPNHVSNPPGKRKLEIDFHTDENGFNKYACHVCGFRGKTLSSLFRKLNVSEQVMKQLNMLITHDGTKEFKYDKFSGLLPEDYVFLPDAPKTSIAAKHARYYLKKRGVTNEDIYRLSIGYCDDGQYDGRIIIPSYDKDSKINFYVGRGWDDNCYPKYIYPEVSRDIVFNDLFINWNEPLILVEGPLDIISVKRNVIPLLGKSITDELMKKIITSKNKKIFMCLDGDALKKSLQHCETLMSYGKKLYLIEMAEDEDPSNMGFEKFTKLLSKAEVLDMSKIMELKLKL